MLFITKTLIVITACHLIMLDNYIRYQQAQSHIGINMHDLSAHVNRTPRA